VGLGEGFAPSAATSVLASQVPARERSSAVATVWGGLDVGSAVGLLLSGPLIQQYGWPSVFYLFAFMGLVWCAFWPLVKPENQDAVMQNEPDKISTNGSSGPSSNSSSSSDKPPSSAVFSSKYTISKEIQGEVPWAEFFKCPAVWAVTVAHFCFNWGYYTLLAWLPSYFEMALGLNVEKSSILTLIPYVAMTMMMPLVGPVADGLVKKGWSLTSVRKLCQGMAFFGPAACMITCALLTPSAAQLAAGVVAPTPILVALLSVAFAMGAWSRGGLYCNHQDLSPKYASALLGITNTAGAIPGVLGVTSAGYLLDATNSWAYALFLPTAACQVFGLVVYSLMASSERQSWS
jgi:ACS family sodium-dependent inorganic phosphate cotransporter